MTNFNLQEIDHILKDFKLLPKEALAAISDDDLEEYERQFAIYVEKTKEDTTLRDTLSSEVRSSIAKLFGSSSNQYRYYERNLSNYTDIVSKHRVKFTPPETIKTEVNEARSKYKIASDASGVGVDENTMSEIDEAIQYLLGVGMEFGKDFGAHNAVDIAMGKTTEIVLDWADKIGTDEEYELENLTLDHQDQVATFNFDNTKFEDLFDGTVEIYEECFDAEIKLKNGNPCISLIGEA